MSRLARLPLANPLAGISVGVVHGEVLLDLCYDEDSQAEVDFNIVMTDTGQLVEVQGTAEGRPFSRDTMDSILEIASEGLQRLFQAQREAIGEVEVVKQASHADI